MSIGGRAFGPFARPGAVARALVAAVVLLIAGCDRHVDHRRAKPAPGPVATADSIGAPAGARADSLVVTKRARRMELWSGGRIVRRYRVDLSPRAVGDKVREGDRRVPEGRFKVDLHIRRSRYHRSLHLSYPDAAHRERARRLGVSPGGDICIHGLPDDLPMAAALLRGRDWTDGCIAVSNPEIEELVAASPVGTPVVIRP